MRFDFSWFNASTPLFRLGFIWLRLLNLFNRASDAGHFWGFGLLQVGRRHLFYMGHSGVSLAFLGVIPAMLLVFLPLPAFAQEAAAPLDLKATLLGAFIQYILPPLATAVGATLVAALTMLAGKFRADGEQSRVKMVLGKVLHFVEVFVIEAEQTVVANLKEAAKDGAISQAELDKIKADVLAKVKAHLGLSGLAELAGVLGGTDPGEGLVDGFIGSHIEAMVHRVSAAAKLATGAVMVPFAASGAPQG